MNISADSDRRIDFDKHILFHENILDKADESEYFLLLKLHIFSRLLVSNFD